MVAMKALAIFAIFFALLALPELARSTEHIVGDHAGWTLNFNYTAWAEDKVFLVGDTLVFKYPVGKHNVFKVDGPMFQACSVPHDNLAMTTGYDVIKLATPGKKWYLCGVNYGKHCQMGMKLFINVHPSTSPAPVPSPNYSSPPTKHIVGDAKGWTLNFNYTAWAENKVFRVGDTLVFNYPVGRHNVYRVDAHEFQVCSAAYGKKAMTTGYDVVHLATPGRKWYLCGVGNHCQMGMKLVITVRPASSPTPNQYPKYSSPPSWAPMAPSPMPLMGPTKHIVGDAKGWTLNFNYTAWAESKLFRVGDSLVFNYPVGRHNVYRVDAHEFQVCSAAYGKKAMTTGYDVVHLATPGRKWYLCGVGNHCQMGMKLVITVRPASSPTPNQYPKYSSPSSWAPMAPSPMPLMGPTKHIVGDAKGWTLNFNYTAWAESKLFRVGDRLVFKYPTGKHNVFKVDGPGFQTCSVPHDDKAMTTGYDVVNLATPGRKWYLCGVGNHCQMGMKLFINVYPTTWSSLPPSSYSPPAWKDMAPSPVTPPAGPTQHVVGDDKGWTLNFDYAAWAKGKTFRVGDTITFKYSVGVHNVFKASKAEFDACNVPAADQAMTTGNDVIPLATPGMKWYICGVNQGGHCRSGMRVAIEVLPATP